MADPVADLVFVGGSVITLDGESSLWGGLAVRNGHIAAVGSARDVMELAGPETRVVDLAGGAVMPGINDTHLHGVALGGSGGTRLIDAMSGGRFEPRRLATVAERRKAITDAVDELVKLGVTSFTEPALGPATQPNDGFGDAMGADGFRAYADLARSGELRARVGVLMCFGEVDGPCTVGQVEEGLRTFRPDVGTDPAMLRVAGVKIFADGIPPMRTAWMREPYEGSTERGALLVEGVGGTDDADRMRALTRMVGLAHRAGHQIGVHATGDRAVEATVDAFVSAIHDGAMRDGWTDARHYIIHGDVVTPMTLRRMGAYGIGLTAQPSIKRATDGALAAALGRRRRDEAVPVRQAVDEGVRACLSSDAPVVSPDWRRSISDAVLRQLDSGEVSGPHQRITVEQGLRAYTATAAWLDRADSWKGTLEAGKVADLCVLQADPLTVDPRHLPDVEVTMTVLGGRVTHENGSLAAARRFVARNCRLRSSPTSGVQSAILHPDDRAVAAPLVSGGAPTFAAGPKRRPSPQLRFPVMRAMWRSRTRFRPPPAAARTLLSWSRWTEPYGCRMAWGPWTHG